MPLPNIYTRSIRNVFKQAPVRVGIVLPGKLLPYAWATAVARLRVYDVIEMFAADSTLVVELYFPGRHYDIVIFEKSLTARALTLARALKHRGTKVALDINVDYFSRTTPRVTAEMQQLAQAFARVADVIIVPAVHLVEALRKRAIHPRIEYIPEPLPDRYFVEPKTSFAAVPRLVWCGYRTKAPELLAIKPQLQQVQAKYGATFTIVSDADPHLPLGQYQFIPYRERTIASILVQNDVGIAPRQFDQPYKYHHTFTKIGIPMACGLPVIASPVPAYVGSPAVLCSNPREWQAAFDDLYAGKLDLVRLSAQGRAYCRREFSWERVRAYYQALFRSLSNDVL